MAERKNEGKTEALKDRKGETLRKRLQPSQAAGLYLGRKTREEPSAVRVALREESTFFSQAGILSIAGRERERSERVAWLERRTAGTCWTLAGRPSAPGTFACCFSRSARLHGLK
jgi:hypothetical protein